MDALTLLHGSSNLSGPGVVSLSAGRMSMSVFLPPSLSPFHYSNIVKVNTQPGLFCRHLAKEVVPDLFPQYKDTFQHAIRRGSVRGSVGQSEARDDQWEARVFSDWSCCDISLRYSNTVMNPSLENGCTDTLLILPKAMRCVTVILWPYLAEHLT